MVVTDIQVTVRQAQPNLEPIRDALQTLPGAGAVEVVVQTDAGVTGRGASWFGRIAGAPVALAAIVEHELKPLVLGTEVTRVRGTHEVMLRETEYHGSAGLTMFGISALDTALWDCLGKSVGLSASQLWGRVHERIPAYAMVGWLNYSDDQVQRICAQAVEQGFRGVKIKVGYPSLAEDVCRVKLVRAAVGDGTALMVDANQSLTTAEAIRRGRAFEDLGCEWWEEPIPADDVDGYAALADALDIPIATGENLYRTQDFARFLRRDAVDILQPDLRRAGGPTALLQIGLMAHAFGRPYASHAGEAAHLHVMAALPNAIYLETGLVGAHSPFQLVDGCVPVPDTPGLHWAEA
jgi:L-alanine-DL-glutamate epimerase-like enolase superfamily enzyme